MTIEYRSLKKLDSLEYFFLKKLSNPMVILKEDLDLIKSVKIIVNTSQLPDYVYDSKNIVADIYTGWIEIDDLKKLDKEIAVTSFAINEKLYLN